MVKHKLNQDAPVITLYARLSNLRDFEIRLDFRNGTLEIE